MPASAIGPVPPAPNAVQRNLARESPDGWFPAHSKEGWAHTIALAVPPLMLNLLARRVAVDKGQPLDDDDHPAPLVYSTLPFFGVRGAVSTRSDEHPVSARVVVSFSVECPLAYDPFNIPERGAWVTFPPLPELALGDGMLDYPADGIDSYELDAGITQLAAQREPSLYRGWERDVWKHERRGLGFFLDVEDGEMRWSSRLGGMVQLDFLRFKLLKIVTPDTPIAVSLRKVDMVEVLLPAIRAPGGKIPRPLAQQTLGGEESKASRQLMVTLLDIPSADAGHFHLVPTNINEVAIRWSGAVLLAITPALEGAFGVFMSARDIDRGRRAEMFGLQAFRKRKLGSGVGTRRVLQSEFLMPQDVKHAMRERQATHLHGRLTLTKCWRVRSQVGPRSPLLQTWPQGMWSPADKVLRFRVDLPAGTPKRRTFYLSIPVLVLASDTTRAVGDSGRKSSRDQSWCR